MNVQHHANGKEKQPQQDGTKRLNICLDFMPIGGVRQHYACHESAKRRRKMEVMHQSRTGEHSEKPDDHEQLPLAKPACQSEKRIKEEPARKSQARYGSERKEGGPPSRRERKDRRGGKEVCSKG